MRAIPLYKYKFLYFYFSSTYVHLIRPTFAVSAHSLCVNNQPQNAYDIKLGLYKHMKQVYG